MKIRLLIMTIFVFVRSVPLFALERTLTLSENDTLVSNHEMHTPSLKKLTVPLSLVTVGAIGSAVPEIRKIDFYFRDEVVRHSFNRTKYDNYAQYFPLALVYGLNLSGIKGKHGFRDLSIIYVTSQLISASIVTPSKYLFAVERPDGSNRKSFPSGHAATAFSTAHFMYREYRDKNLLLSLSGYPFAAFTGISRVVNNRHWASDVLTGAGIGILSTEMAYWLFPKINGLMGKSSMSRSMSVMPFYSSRAYGVHYSFQINGR